MRSFRPAAVQWSWAICTFIFLAYVYVKSRSVFVTALAHVTMNNSAASFSYFVTVRDQTTANFGLTLTMVIVVAILYFSNEFSTFEQYFRNRNSTRHAESTL